LLGTPTLRLFEKIGHSRPPSRLHGYQQEYQMIETEERSLRGVALSRLATVGRMTAYGASSSLWLNPAKVSLVNPQPAFSFGGENRS
jgi:hypothetical protein